MSQNATQYINRAKARINEQGQQQLQVYVNRAELYDRFMCISGELDALESLAQRAKSHDIAALLRELSEALTTLETVINE